MDAQLELLDPCLSSALLEHPHPAALASSQHGSLVQEERLICRDVDGQLVYTLSNSSGLMILKQIPDVRVGLGSGDALVIKFFGYSPCLHKHVSAEELGDLSLRETRSESTSICVILQICRGLAVTKSSMGRAALPPWILASSPCIRLTSKSCHSPAAVQIQLGILLYLLRLAFPG